MAIDGALREKLAPGTLLMATYKKVRYDCIVEEEDGKTVYRLYPTVQPTRKPENIFKSPSAAGSAVMGGIACNGWRFWSVADGDASAPETDEPTPIRSGSSDTWTPTTTNCSHFKRCDATDGEQHFYRCPAHPDRIAEAELVSEDEAPQG